MTHDTRSRRLPSVPGPKGAEIRAARERLDLSASQAGALLDWTEKYWRKIEDGSVTITQANWELWLHKAGVKPIPFTPRK